MTEILLTVTIIGLLIAAFMVDWYKRETRRFGENEE